MGLTVTIKYSFLGSAKILGPSVLVFNLAQTVRRSQVSWLYSLRLGMKRSNSLVAIYGGFGNGHQATEAQWLKKSTCQCRIHKGHRVRKVPWNRKWQPTPVFLPGKSHEERSLVDCSPWGCKGHD